MNLNTNNQQNKASLLSKLICDYKTNRTAQENIDAKNPPKDYTRMPLYSDLRVAEYYKKNKTTAEFLERCVRNWYRHQRRLSISVAKNAASVLAGMYASFNNPSNFEALRDTIAQAIGGIKGINNVAIYDTSLRIGYCMSPQIQPKDYVYVHTLLIDSACKILGKLNVVNGCRIPIKDFYAVSPSFNALNAAEIEDFLCVKHSDIMKLP